MGSIVVRMLVICLALLNIAAKTSTIRLSGTVTAQTKVQVLDHNQQIDSDQLQTEKSVHLADLYIGNNTISGYDLSFESKNQGKLIGKDVQAEYMVQYGQTQKFRLNEKNKAKKSFSNRGAQTRAQRNAIRLHLNPEAEIPQEVEVEDTIYVTVSSY